MARTLTRDRRSAPRDADEDYEADTRDEDTDEDEGRGRRSATKRRSRRDDSARGKGRSARSERPRGTIGSGREAYNQAKARGSKYSAGDKFTVEDEEELIHFLEEWAFASWNEHWVDEIRDGKKSFVCLGDDCPLCDFGIRVGYKAAFNIVTFDKKGNPVVKYWIATPDPLAQIEAKDDNNRTHPINREELYFAVSKKKAKGRRYTYSMDTVSLDDVRDDFKIDPLSEDELEELASELFTEEDVVKVSSRKELLAVVEDLED